MDLDCRRAARRAVRTLGYLSFVEKIRARMPDRLVEAAAVCFGWGTCRPMSMCVLCPHAARE
eukprot:scaffold1325_cov138-Amphora_coffeaeformis.AAC.13